MSQYNLEDVNNTFAATFGDRVGWTFLTGNKDFVFSIDAYALTYFYDFETAATPAVGDIVSIRTSIIQLPFVYSIAVRVDLDISKYTL